MGRYRNILVKFLAETPPASIRYRPLTREKKMAKLEDRWLSVDEISKYLGVSNDTVYRWIDTHDMPAHRMGRFWKFKQDEVDAWVRSGGAADKSDKQDTAE